MRLLDALEQRRQNPRLGHPGLVDDDYAEIGELVSEETVECGRADARLDLQFLGRDSGGGSAEHRDAARLEGGGDGAGGGGLTASSQADDADDAIAASGYRAQHRRLLRGQRLQILGRGL